MAKLNVKELSYFHQDLDFYRNIIWLWTSYSILLKYIFKSTIYYLNIFNFLKNRESLNRLKQRIKDCKKEVFSTESIRKERNDHLLLSCLNSEQREEIIQEEHEAPLRISISLNKTEAYEDQDKEEELLTNKMPYDYDFADFMAFKKQQEAELALSKKIRFIYGTDKSLDEISLK